MSPTEYCSLDKTFTEMILQMMHNKRSQSKHSCSVFSHPTDTLHGWRRSTQKTQLRGRQKQFHFVAWGVWFCIYCRVLTYSLFSGLALCPVSVLRCPPPTARCGSLLFMSLHSPGLEQKLGVSGDGAPWPSSSPQGPSTGAQPEARGLTAGRCHHRSLHRTDLSMFTLT